MWLDYKLTRYEGMGFLRNLNIRIHRDITGEMWFGVDWLAIYLFTLEPNEHISIS